MEDVKEISIRMRPEKLSMACISGNLKEVEDILDNEEVDINNGGVIDTPLFCAVLRGHPDIVRRLLGHPGLRLDQRNVFCFGESVLHYACEMNRLSIVRLLCQDSRCTPSVVNMKDREGDTPLMRAVFSGHLDIIKELDKKGTDFFTKNSSGVSLITMARMKSEAVLEYLLERNKVDSLEVIAAHNVARYISNKADVETLEIPETLLEFLASFVENEDNQDIDDERNNV